MYKIPSLFILGLVAFISCNKEASDTLSGLSPIQQKIAGKWRLHSVTHLQENGPGRFLYRGSGFDYFDFSKDSIYTYVLGRNVNAGYNLLGDDSTMALVFPMPDGSKKKDTMFITSLSSNLLVLRGKVNPGEIGIDSLVR